MPADWAHIVAIVKGLGDAWKLGIHGTKDASLWRPDNCNPRFKTPAAAAKVGKGPFVSRSSHDMLISKT